MPCPPHQPAAHGVGGLVDPPHDGAAVRLAAPVHVGRRGQEPQDDPGAVPASV